MLIKVGVAVGVPRVGIHWFGFNKEGCKASDSRGRGWGSPHGQEKFDIYTCTCSEICSGGLLDCLYFKTFNFLLLRVCMKLFVFYGLTKCNSLKDEWDSNYKADLKNNACMYYYLKNNACMYYTICHAQTTPPTCCFS